MFISNIFKYANRKVLYIYISIILYPKMDDENMGKPLFFNNE